VACPAHINVQGYVALISKGKYKEAVELIYQNLPLPGVLGRVCPHPCETACRRAEKDQPISICKLKRFAADQVDYSTLTIPEITPREEKVAIVGSGPAGLSAAYYLALKGYKTSIFEAAPVLGGWLRVGIPEYRLPRDVLDKEINHIVGLGVEAKTNTALGKDFTVDDLKNQGYKAVFLGVGCQKGAKLAIPGEDSTGVIQGVDFLRDAALGKKFEGIKKAVVIGGGNVAIDAARTLLRLGADSTILYRRSRAEMPAFGEEVHAALEEGVKIQFLVAPAEVVTSGGKVTGLKAVRMELGEPDASGRRRPVPVVGSEHVINADTIIPAIGQVIDPGFWDSLSGLGQTRKNTIESDKVTYATSIEGVFAGGDAVSGPATVVEAVAAGKEVAESIHRFINGMNLAENRPYKYPENPEYPPIPEELKSESRAITPEIAVSDRKGFKEVELALAEEDALREANRCLNCGVCSECMECVKACPAQAIDHTMEDAFMDVEVGSVILSTGYEMIDPGKIRGEFSYGTAPNVLTNMEFERMLSASGPNAGEVRRPSDDKHPRKVAWIQCVGSRDAQKDMPHCSSICCMASIKEAVIAKEHDANIEPTIFYMDIRAYGKDFDKYYEKAKTDGGVRFIRSMVSRVVEDPLTHSLQITFLNEQQKLVTETFDMVVLAVGLKTSEQSISLANKLGIGLNESRFCKTTSFEPVSTNREGIFVAGMFQGPKDIPQTVMEASAAAGVTIRMLADQRNTLTLKKELPPEKDFSGQEPRIGVFVCRCGINIAATVDVPSVVDRIRELPGVVHACENLFTCSLDTQSQIKKVIEESSLNRVVVASCTPRTHLPLFQQTAREAGLNKYLVDMANIREHCSWVHMSEKEKATDKAVDLIRMVVARAARLEQIQDQQLPMVQSALVIGGGVAGMVAALNLGDQGFPTHLLEATDKLGGNAWNLSHTLKNESIHPFLEGMIKKVQDDPKITVHFNSNIKDVHGFVGAFRTEISTEKEVSEVIEHGVTVVATGASEWKPNIYSYGQDPRIRTHLEMTKAMKDGDPQVWKADTTVFIQCVGSRCPERPWCSKVCCNHTVMDAIELKEANPAAKIFVLYRDIRTFGLNESYYEKARRLGVIFARYEPEAPPAVQVGSHLQVSLKDLVLGGTMEIEADNLVLASAIIPNEYNKELANFFKISTNEDGYFLEAHMKLRPVDFATDGIFLAGLAHYPKPLDETIAQAEAAGSHAAQILARGYVDAPGMVSVVDQYLCRGCGRCVDTCPFDAPALKEVSLGVFKSEINPALCKGCGACGVVCPTGAASIRHFKDDQISPMIDVAVA
jgi:heterodisulfide reductase subunit A-like polyferredoxin